jgi:uncharacterized protein YecE (DUF72 family)
VQLRIGTSGWSYPSWRGGFYPVDAKPADFLGHYAERFDTVELNTTKYRLPSEDQFARWAEQVPAGFEFAPKLPAFRLDRIGVFFERVRLLRDRLGPVRVQVQQARDDGWLMLLLGSVEPGTRLAFDFRHESWDGIELPREAAVVNDFERDAELRYVRLREPPYSEEELREWAVRIRAQDVPTYVYLRHEDEPTAPAYADRLRELVGGSGP